MTRPFYHGGQAVIEGVMMRGQKNVAIAVRQPNGEVNITTQPLPSLYKGHLREVPFVRGFIILIETLVLGVEALLHSAQVAVNDKPEEKSEEIPPILLWGTVILGIAFAVALFFLAPLFLTRYLIDPYLSSSIVSNLVEGVIRIGVFVAYLKVISLIPDIRNVFAYHGAEHKVVNAYEAGVPLELEAVKGYSTAHVRCGTSFLLIVLVIAIIVFALLGRPVLWLSILSRIVLIPVIAAVGYEIVRLSAAHNRNAIVRALLTPGLALQAMTTREPNDRQIETALSAMKKVIEADKEESLQPPEGRSSADID